MTDVLKAYYVMSGVTRRAGEGERERGRERESERERESCHGETRLFSIKGFIALSK